MNTDYEKIEKSAKVKNNVKNTIVYILLGLWALMVIFPFYWMVLTSVKSYGSYNAEYIPKFFTLSPTLQNYIDAFTTVDLGQYFLNTIIFTVATTAIMIVVIVP
ncbi:MAG: carbohydrate ABC transporter permease, partial [Clostridia bacterium]|nr:carbohydrate ABC transporter permease [Clostridia bacterium]